MDKKSLIKSVSTKTNYKPKEVEAILDGVIEEIKEAVVKGKKLTIANFGVFEQKERAEKVGTHPGTGERIVIDKKIIPNFRPGKEFKNRLEN